MAKQKKVPSGPQVDRGSAKGKIKDRTDCSSLVKNKASSSPIWQQYVTIQAAGNDLVIAGTDLSAADLAYVNAQIVLDNARTTVDTKTVAWNVAFEAYASLAEKYSLKPEDLTSLALSPLTRSVYALLPPIGVELKYEVKLNVLRVHVIMPTGMDAAEVEMSPDPVTPTSWKRLVGHGLVREVASPAPGTWWFHAATARASEQSAFTQAYSILIK
jgi:hypothetical protein